MREAFDAMDSGDQTAIISVLDLGRHEAQGGTQFGGGATGSNNTGTWTAEENKAFEDGLHEFGRDWKKISTLVKTRNLTQIRR